jgi:dolichyl-diphosphooligosaccharide--protein glycosyltransferase
MRKRARLRGRYYETKPAAEAKHHVEKFEREKKKQYKKNALVALSVAIAFIMVLFLTCYFNYSSGIAINEKGTTLSERFYLSGPDPYYNARLIEQTLKTGHYPYLGGVHGGNDPLLNYPLTGSGGRPPLFNYLAIGVGKLLSPFLGEVDAIGYAMHFLPAIYGALLVIPVYFIGALLFNRKAGIIAAFLVPLIPIHLGSGHGAAYSLFDHDSFVLLLLSTVMMFLIMSLKEDNAKKSTLYAALAGVFVAAVSLTWVSAHYVYAVIALYAAVQMVVDIFTSKINTKIVRIALVALFTGYIITFPLYFIKAGTKPMIPLYLSLGVVILSGIYLFIGRKKIPWIVSVPSLFGLGAVVLIFLYLIRGTTNPIFQPLAGLSEVLFSGVYHTKVSLTIAEAGTFGFSRIVMSFGPVLYWLSWIGAILLVIRFIKKREKEVTLFLTWFFLETHLLLSAGRFINDLVPHSAILSGFVIWYVIEKIDYKSIIRNIRGIGLSLRGLKKAIKFSHVAGVLFLAFLIVIPNAYLAFDAALPYGEKQKFAESKSLGAFGLSLYKEAYWVDALSWLSRQDTDLPSTKRPAFIAWWDYGFYEVAIGNHPTVADNFQEGIPPAGNFHTATSEEEAVAVMIVRILEGVCKDKGTIPQEIKDIMNKYLSENDTANITKWIENPKEAPSVGKPIGEKYDEELSKEFRVRPENAIYHDSVKILANLSDENITWLYHDIQNITGKSIRYYGVEGYDLQIFNVFTFLSDKSNVVRGAGEDDYLKVWYKGYEFLANGETVEKRWTPDEIKDMSIEDRRNIRITGTEIEYKPQFFETMFYRTYIGPPTQDRKLPPYPIPTYGMRHFSAEYISPVKYLSPYARLERGPAPAVVIAKYYEGAIIKGSIKCMNKPYQAQIGVYKNATVWGINISIPHDNTITNTDGTFSLIAPAGEIILKVNFGEHILKNIVFNNTNSTNYSPITEEEATRKPGTNYIRQINITIEPASIHGYVYEDLNNNETAAPNATITIEDEFYGEKYTTTTNSEGYYSVENLTPSQYRIVATLNGFEIHNKSVFLEPGANFYNISKPKPATLKGIAFYDENNNNTYDKNEEKANITINLTYIKTNTTVDTTVTNATGKYMFTEIIPGKYVLEAYRINATTGIKEYEKREEITLDANETREHNISLDLAKVEVKGYTKYNEVALGNISIDFMAADIENNTAEFGSTITNNETAYYEIKLRPGTYDVSAYTTRVENEKNVTYSYDGTLVVNIAEKPKWYNISLQRIEG